MAGKFLSDNDLAFMDKFSYTPPEKVEYDTNDYVALGQQVNTGMALYNRGKFETMDVDLSQYGDKEVTSKSIMEELSKQGYDSRVVDEVASDGTSDTWDRVERRAQYLKDVFEKEQQVSENFSTPGMIAAGLPMALFDVDSLVISPMLAVSNKAYKALNLSSKMSKVASHAVTGGAVGATSMIAYEAATGVYRDDSLIESAMFGATLGGSLGFFVERASKNPSLEKTTDVQGNVLPTTEDQKVEQIAKANVEYSTINRTIDEVEELLKGQKQTQKDLALSERNDKGVEQFDNSLYKKRLDDNRQQAQESWKNSVHIREEAKKELSTASKAVESIKASMRQLDRSMKIVREQLSLKAPLTKQASPIKEKITKLTNQIKKLEGKTDEDAIAKRKELEVKLAAQEKKLARVDAKLQRIDAKLAKQEQDPKAKQKELVTLKDQALLAKKAAKDKLTKAEKDVKDKKEAHSKASKAYREVKIKIDSSQVADSASTSSLRDRLAKYEASLSPEGLRKLMEKQGVLAADIAKMEADDFNVSTLYGIQKTKANYVDKLAKELDDVGLKEDIRESDTFKKLPKWAAKLMISPITKLLNSDIAAVRGFASKLHSGTVYQGRISNMTAWVVKQMDDDVLNRLNKSMINLYRQASKDGYKGSLDDFHTEVAQASYKTTGNMQRQIYTGMDGGLSTADKLNLAKQRAGSVKATEFSDNKYINQAVKEHLGYYEYIHKRGSELGLEAMKGTLGKAYTKRVYNAKKINDYGRDKAIQDLVDAQFSKAESMNMPITQEVVDSFRSKATKAIDETLSGEAKRKSLTESMGLPRQSTTSSLKQRTIDVFDDDIAHLLEDDIINTTTFYGIGMHGRLALKEKLGVDNNEQFEKMLDELRSEGASIGEIDNLRVVAQTILGTREVSKNPYDPFTRAVKAVSTATSALHTLAFAVPTVTEIASVAKEFGISKTISNLVGRPRDIYKMYKDGTPSDQNTIELMVSYGDAHFNMKSNRFDVESNFDSVGKFQEFMDGVVHKESIFGGLLPITDMLRMTTTSLYVDFLAKLSVAKKISSADMKRLQDTGFGVEDLPRIKEKLNVQPDGRIGNMDRKSWGELDRELTAGALTTVERTILHPNGITLPKFMTNMNEGQFLPRVALKFMRFPVESYERMLVRGMQEADAKQALAVAANIGMWAGILAMKDALREDDKKVYEDEASLIKAALLYNSFTSAPVALVDTASGLLTGKNLTSDYRYRIGGAVQSNYEAAQRGDVNVRIPFGNINIGEGVSQALQTLKIIEETNKE